MYNQNKPQVIFLPKQKIIEINSKFNIFNKGYNERINKDKVELSELKTN